MSVVGGELILQLVLVLCFGSDNRPARVVLSPPELLVVATPEGSVLSHELVFHLFREPRLVVSVDTDCPCGDARFHSEAYAGCHSVCEFVKIGNTRAQRRSGPYTRSSRAVPLYSRDFFTVFFIGLTVFSFGL